MFKKPKRNFPKNTAPVLNTDILRALQSGARNLFLVRIVYTDSHGVMSTRDTEPYEIKEGKYWAYCQTSGGVRQFTIAGISSAEVLDIKYSPRWAVKIL